ncbi:restriction endonuclease subunit S [bacterium]|nr:restriction endonuclease subunit S [bacterium]
MKDGWTYGILDDAVYKDSSNLSLTKIKGDDGEYPVFGAKGFVQNVSFYQQESEYLGIIKDGAGIGRVSKHPPKSSILATMQYIIPKEGYDIQFINYFLNYIDFEKYRTGSTIPHIYYKDYKYEVFPLIDIHEQKCIVSKLDACFDAIDKAKANVEKNLQNAKELFQSKLNEIFSQKGDGWVEKKLGEIAEIIYGYTAKAKHEQATYKYLRITDIQNNNVNWDSVPYCDLDEIEFNKYCLKFGDIVFARTGATTGKSFIIKNPPKAVFASYLIRVQINNKELNPDFLYLFFQSSYYWYLINKGITGSAQGGFNASKLKELSISFPESSEMQSNYIKEMEELKSQTQSLESKYQQELVALDELKKSILQKAFEGEL